jgi:hypothetical protein
MMTKSAEECTGPLVQLIPKSKRAKDRVGVHGKVMILCDAVENGGDESGPKFLVRSVEKTASWKGVKEFWVGSFDKESEASYARI